MLKRLLLLELKAFIRSASMGKSIGLKILMLLLALYFSIIFLLAGIGLYPLVIKYMPGEEPLMVVNRFVLLWLLLELLLRFFLQAIPILDIKPLIHLPIRKRKVVNFVLLKSIFSFFNFLPLLLIVPFGLFNIYNNTFPTSIIIAWMLALFGLSLCVNFVNFVIKKKFSDKPRSLLPLLLIALTFAILDYFQFFQITLWFGWGLDLLLEYPLLAFIPFVLFAALFFWNQYHLETKFYLDSGLMQRKKSINTNEFHWTRYFVDMAPFLQQDLKLIWRNKRPKTSVYMSLLLLGYGLIFYPQEVYQGMPAFFIFVGIFMTGIFMVNYGQFIPAWDAGYYPLIMSQNISMEKYLKAKAGLITLSIVALTILATPYLYYGWKIFFINIVCAIYNIGVNIPILLYAGSFNRKRIDLEKSQFMNYQGIGVAQWLVALPLMLIPVLIFWAGNKFLSFEIGIILLLGLGIGGLLLRSSAIDFIALIYRRNKYEMLEGFSQKGE